MDKRLYYLFGACFLVGITLGSVIGLGSGAGVALSDNVAAWRYIVACALTNLPFWCGIILPCTVRNRMIVSGVALTIKGLLIGCSSVFIFSADRSLYYYTVNILPQLLTMAPMYIFAAVMQAKRVDRPGSNTVILTNLSLSVLVTFLTSCVQYLFFVAFHTIQVVFITKF